MRRSKLRAVRCTYPFGTVIDVADGIPDLAQYPKLESSGRENGLLETPDHRPTMRGTVMTHETDYSSEKTNIVSTYGTLSRVFA